MKPPAKLAALLGIVLVLTSAIVPAGLLAAPNVVVTSSGNGATNTPTATHTPTTTNTPTATNWPGQGNYCQTNQILVPSSGTVGPAAPFPSTITVAGLGGLTSNVTVDLLNFTHTFPDDIDALLVGPAGQKVMLMSDAGGPGDVVGFNLTFATGFPIVPDTTVGFFPGSYAPTNYDGGDNPTEMPAPAPAAPYSILLTDFNGLDPNGIWSLYVYDDVSEDSGTIGSWCLHLTTSLSPTATNTPTGLTPTATNTNPPSGVEVAGVTASPAGGDGGLVWWLVGAATVLLAAGVVLRGRKVEA